ncbi:hypothetical protein [Mycetohabitans rhizoxinica]|uniref:hypothetical protein n=1 Tax=Mycetohabitans rhizoxinica TaxID=412963 RepID=UPI0030CE8439
MGLQSSSLVMVGLGIRGDNPPLADQPPLVDGIHLRWTTSHERAFPWHGFFLFRRRGNREVRQVCISAQGQPPNPGQTELLLGDGRLTSPVPLVFTSNWPSPGVQGIDLRDRPYVRFDRATDRLMRQIRLKIAFGEPHRARRCIDFIALPKLVHLPITIDGVEISGGGPRAGAARAVTVPSKELGGLPMLVVGAPLEVLLPGGAGAVDIQLIGVGTAIVVEGFDSTGRSSAQQSIVVAADELQTIRIAGEEIVQVRIRPVQGLLRLLQIYFTPVGTGYQRILIEGLDQLPGTDLADAMTVASHEAVGTPGTIAVVELLADRMSGVRVGGSDAAILDICWGELRDAATAGWQPVPHCPQPLSLPSRHPDYPAWTGAVDRAAAEAAAVGRVRYGAPGTWAGAAFKDLHDACIRLIQGGPGAGPMTAASRTIPLPAPPNRTTPALRSLHPLDIVMAGSLHRPIAEMLGLSWTDETAQPGAIFDYMIVADHVGVSGGDPRKVLAHIVQSGFDDGIDAWIVFGLQVEPQAPVASPAGTVVYALPGGPVRDDAGVVRNAAGSAGLDWPHGPSVLGWLDPRAPVMHHVYRADCGTENTPVVPAEARNWLTKNQPLVSARPAGAPGPLSAALPTWPPKEPGYLDLRLDEGWYAYQLVAVDLLGRFSPRSPYASWWQWAPEPVPRPWYYVGSSVDAEIHPQAVRIIDKTRPPVPLGVEAYVLDPDDPIVVKDAAYDAWRVGLGPEGAATIGLRLRWRWSPEQQQRAPNVSEFRLYWSGGSAPPAGWQEPAAWQDRFFVCAYGNNVTYEGDGTRIYEVFLPAAGGGPMAGGVPLAPSLDKVIDYANVSATAADSTPSTADRWPGAGPFAERPGNESQCAPAQRVFRVWRQRPAPPSPIVDSDRVYATPADWHGHSYHTFRWVPQPNLSAHVWRALDEAVFDADWAAQPRTPLTAADPAFPDVAAEPIWTPEKKAQVAELINAIGALLPIGPSLAQKAAAKPGAMALYRAFSDDALRVLANRQGCERAFVQVTIKPLAAADAPDRRGPDDPAGYAPSSARCAYVDKVDGRATNRLLYRASFVDGAQNRSVLGACATPVRLPDVTPPRAPAITHALGGDRRVTLQWASNREPDLFEYRVYRASSELDARDLRTMMFRAAIAADPDPANRPVTVEWADDPAPGLCDLWYRVVAIDRTDPDPRGHGGNVSEPSTAIWARAFDEFPPEPPAITVAEWIRIDDSGERFAFEAPIPAGATRLPAIHLSWENAGQRTRLLVQLRSASEATFQNASPWLAPGTTDYVFLSNRTFEQIDLRLKVLNEVGHTNVVFHPAIITPV